VREYKDSVTDEIGVLRFVGLMGEASMDKGWVED
jgi:hypothetical protein